MCQYKKSRAGAEVKVHFAHLQYDEQSTHSSARAADIYEVKASQNKSQLEFNKKKNSQRESQKKSTGVIKQSGNTTLTA